MNHDHFITSKFISFHFECDTHQMFVQMTRIDFKIGVLMKTVNRRNTSFVQKKPVSQTNKFWTVQSRLKLHQKNFINRHTHTQIQIHWMFIAWLDIKSERIVPCSGPKNKIEILSTVWETSRCQNSSHYVRKFVQPYTWTFIYLWILSIALIPSKWKKLMKHKIDFLFHSITNHFVRVNSITQFIAKRHTHTNTCDMSSEWIAIQKSALIWSKMHVKCDKSGSHSWWTEFCNCSIYLGQVSWMRAWCELDNCVRWIECERMGPRSDVENSS